MPVRKSQPAATPPDGDDSFDDDGHAGELHEIVSSIGPKLRELRIQRGMSLHQLAAQSDVSAAAIHKIERGGMVPTITTLLKIAGVQPARLLLRRGPARREPPGGPHPR